MADELSDWVPDTGAAPATVATPTHDWVPEKAPVDDTEIRASTPVENLTYRAHQFFDSLEGPKAPDSHVAGVKTEASDIPGKIGSWVAEQATNPVNLAMAPLAAAAGAGNLILKGAGALFGLQGAKALNNEIPIANPEAGQLAATIADPDKTKADVAVELGRTAAAAGMTLAGAHGVTAEAPKVAAEDFAKPELKSIGRDEPQPTAETSDWVPDTGQKTAPEPVAPIEAETRVVPQYDLPSEPRDTSGEEANLANLPDWAKDQPAPETPPEPETPAAETPPEPAPPSSVTATKNEQVDAEREARGLPPAMEAAARDFPDVWNHAMRIIDENPQAASELEADLKENPRAATDTENAILLHRQIELQNEFAKVSDRINEAPEGTDTSADQIRHAQLSDELLNLYDTLKTTGTESGRGLNARRMMANEDFSLASMVTERRAAKGGRALTPEELAETEALHQKIADTQKAFDDYVRQASEKIQKLESAKAETARKSRVSQYISEKAAGARERIKSRLAEGRQMSGLDPQDLADHAIIGAEYIAKGVEAFGEWSKAMLDEFGERIKPHLQAIFEKAKETVAEGESAAKEASRLQSMKTRTRRSTEKLQSKLAARDFGPTPKPAPVVLDEEALQLKSENERAKQQYQEAVLKDRIEKMSTPEKLQSTFVKWRRGFLLSNPLTLVKLTSAALQRMAFTPLEEGVGGAIGAAVPDLAERAPREGGINATAEARAITQGITQGMKDAADLIRTGKSNLEVLFGKAREGGVRESDVMPRSMIDFFGELHGALKSPVKRAEFARSLEKRMAFAAAHGVDVTDPMVQTRLMAEAYKDAERSIFLQDNVVVNAYNRAIGALLEKQKSTGRPSPGGRLTATVAKTLLPIVRVPTNIVAETMQYAVGSITGSVRLGLAMRAGMENLHPEQADLIMRQLKKGSLGAAAMLVGYFNADKIGGYYQPGKRPAKEPAFGSIRFFGHDIPSILLHSPLMETVQIGATIRRVAESKLHRSDHDKQGLGTGVWATALGLTEEVPFAREPVELAKVFNPTERAGAEGELAKSIAVPAAVEFAAQQMDRDAKGNLVKRAPDTRHGEAKTVIQHVETAIPGLRQTVPKK